MFDSAASFVFDFAFPPKYKLFFVVLCVLRVLRSDPERVTPKASRVEGLCSSFPVSLFSPVCKFFSLFLRTFVRSLLLPRAIPFPHFDIPEHLTGESCGNL